MKSLVAFLALAATLCACTPERGDDEVRTPKVRRLAADSWNAPLEATVRNKSPAGSPQVEQGPDRVHRLEAEDRHAPG
jgi:hypothetical protein